VISLDASAASLRQATVTENSGNGIGLFNGSVLSLYSSKIGANVGDGLYLEVSLASVRSNEIINNVGFGIFADSGSLLSGYENTISGNGTDYSETVPESLTQAR
jgi:nitrous oxidase accessory protein NosD